MYVKLSPEDLNSNICPLHLTSTYTCGVTIVPKVCGGNYIVTHVLNFFIVLKGKKKKPMITAKKN